MQHITYHRFLLKAPDPEQARHYIHRFLDRTTLIKYSAVKFNDALSFSAEDPSFWGELDKGIAENNEAVTGFCEELRSHGYTAIEDLQNMPQGFASKILHTLVHLLDGFIGVDSHLYNLGGCPRMPFFPNSSLFAKFYPRNINYMPVVKFSKCLDLRKNCYSRTASCWKIPTGSALLSVRRSGRNRISTT